MSLLSRDELHIFIGPQQLDLVQLRGRGRRLVVDSRAVSIPAATADMAPWHNVLAALEALLVEFHACKAKVIVVLSNHFVHYALVSHGAETKNAEERQALIHHYFANIYGPAAEQWEYRLSDSGESDEQLMASAVDTKLTDSLKILFANSGLTLASIQPHLMAAFNSSRKEIDASAWFTIVEPGILCLVRLERSAWTFVRTVNSRADWLDDLENNLYRAKVLTNEAVSEVPVYVFAPGNSETQWEQLEKRTSDTPGTVFWRLPRTYDDSSDLLLPRIPLFSLALSG